ncbi:glycosyltransferase [Thermodesulfobacteriota bacterium]
MIPELAIVLLSKNQAWNISRLIESVLNVSPEIASTEVVLVDSASTDATIEIACKYQISVIQLDKNQHLCPSAGRYTGYNFTSSELVLFLDGDNELYPGWLEKALHVLKNNHDVAAISGPRIPLPLKGKDADKPPLLNPPVEDMKTVWHPGGTALYRRSVLKQVGTFNPFLYSDEEPELAFRIRNAGYRIVMLEHPICYDYTDPAGELSTLYKRWKRNLYLGRGQTLRYHLGKDSFWNIVKERGFGISPLIFLIAMIYSLVWYLITGEKIMLTIVGAAFIVFVLGDLLRRRSLKKTVTSLFKRLVAADGTIRGFFLTPHPPESYPKTYRQIQ